MRAKDELPLKPERQVSEYDGKKEPKHELIVTLEQRRPFYYQSTQAKEQRQTKSEEVSYQRRTLHFTQGTMSGHERVDL
jgi:hypothetical protein